MNERKSKLAVAAGAHAVQDGLGAALYVLMPLLAQTYGFSYTQVGLLKGLKSLAQGLLEVFSGNVVERLGEGRTLVLGLLASALGFLILISADAIATILVCLLLIGAGTALHHAPSSSLVSRAFADGGRRSALGLYNSSGDVGKLVFTGMFSLAVGVGLIWQQVVTLYGFIALLTAGLIAMALKAFRAAGDAQDSSSTSKPQNERDLGWGILDTRAYSALLATIFLDNIVQAGFLVFVPFLMLSKGVPLVYAMFATVIVLVGGVFGKAACGYLAERMGVRSAFRLVQLLTGAGLVCVVVAPSWLAVALLLPLGVVAQGSTSITYGIVDDLIDTRRTARGYALMYGSTGIAAALGPFVIGFASDVYGIEVAMLFMAAIALLAIAPMDLLPPHVAEPDAVS